MDPLTAIGLAGNILTFIDYSYKVITGVNSILSSKDGMIPENESLGILAKDLNAVTQSLITDIQPQTANEKQLCVLSADCHTLSTELFQILSDLKVGNKKSKWEALTVKWKSMRKEKDIALIEQRLNSYQSQILIRLQVMFSQKSDEQSSFVNNHLEAIRSAGEDLQNQTISRLDKVREEISVRASFLGSGRPQGGSEEFTVDGSLAGLSTSLSELRTVASPISRENNILQRLSFPEMYSRQNNIEDPEGQTFAWIVQDENQLDGDDLRYHSVKSQELNEEESASSHEMILHGMLFRQEDLRVATRLELLTWLESGRHIFHISGKAGSGKSTLMKFLSGSSKVKERLEVWRGEETLIFAQFFFWNSGSKILMSLEGLYRSLLFETCRQSPDLIPLIFPDSWKNSNSGAVPISFDETKSAFHRLIQEASCSTKKFCFFIDGLDEFKGDEVDHWRFARDIQSWTEKAANIKVCVSSRPHVPFIQSFSNDLNHGVSIHQLTRKDILEFGLAMFEQDPNFHRVKDLYKELVFEVVEACDGVFLWARLVVRSLLRSIGYHGSEKDLKRKLQLMPRGLDQLFDQILNSIDPEDQLRSDMLFLLTIPDFSWRQPVVDNAVLYSWLEDLEDPEFPYNSPSKPCADHEVTERLDLASCTLDRLSRGLLEISRAGIIHWHPAGGHLHDYYAYQVNFLHRSAREYISNTREAQMKARVPSFDIHSAICRLSLAELKFAPSPNQYTKSKAYPHASKKWHLDNPLENSLQNVQTVASLAHTVCGYHVPSRLLEELDRIILSHTKILQSRTEVPSEAELQHMHTPYGIRACIVQNDVYNGYSMLRDPDNPPDFLCGAVPLHLQHFMSPDMMGCLRKRNLDSGLSPNLLLVSAIYCGNMEFLRSLLCEGRSPKEMVDMEQICAMEPLRFTDFGEDDFLDSDSDSHTEKLTPQTIAPRRKSSVWLLFLYMFAETSFAHGHSLDPEALCIEEFLKCDVECDVTFVARVSASMESEGPEEVIVFDLLELLKIFEPSNMDALRAKLPSQAVGKEQSEVTPISEPPVLYTRQSLSQLVDRIKRDDKKKGFPALYKILSIRSVITPSERLDAPFAFRMT